MGILLAHLEVDSYVALLTWERKSAEKRATLRTRFAAVENGIQRAPLSVGILYLKAGATRGCHGLGQPV